MKPAGGFSKSEAGEEMECNVNNSVKGEDKADYGFSGWLVGWLFWV